MAASQRESKSVSRVHWEIGAAEECIIRIQCAQAKVAHLDKLEGRLFIKALPGNEEVLVNGERVSPGSACELTRFDDVYVGGTAIVLGAELFLGNTHVGLDTTALRYARLEEGAEQVLCEGAYLRALPGTLTAIMGPSGCGKTVFLNLLAGDLRPGKGRVLVGGEFDLHAQRDELGSFVGYVPQDDVLLPDLTVQQSLDFRLQLRFPDMAREVRARLVQEACRQIGIDRSRMEPFLNTRIGSPELGKRGLSGGERKRANIAHELLLKPLVLVLDEPTSGLSSLDADQMVRFLHGLAHGQGVTVICTLHQPSRTAFECLDDLLVMTPGGAPAFYGPADEAVTYLEQASEVPYAPDQNPAEFILNLLADSQEARRLVRCYQARPLREPLSFVVPACSLVKPAADFSRAGRGRGVSFWGQLKTLVARNMALLRAERSTLYLTFGQAPFLGLLILLAFLGFQEDGLAWEEFAAKMHLVGSGAQSYRKESQPVPIDELVEQADKPTAAKRKLISRQAAFRLGGIYFALVAASIWFGIMGGCKEVVTEKHVLRREHKTGLGLPAYVSGKISVLGAQAGVQTGLMLVIVVPGLLGLNLLSVFGLWLVLWGVAISAAALGLWLSSLAPSYRFALMAVPVLLIPQILFGGMLRPAIDITNDFYVARGLSCLTLQRWGFAAALSLDPYADGGVILPSTPAAGAAEPGALGWIEFREGSLPECFFAANQPAVTIFTSLGWLAAGTAISLGASLVVLRRRLGGAEGEQISLGSRAAKSQEPGRS
jgi:ABC-type multidrug transport system ATPase subunit